MDVEIETRLNYINPSIPLVAMSKGMNVVTEGVLTIKGAVEILKDVKVKSQSQLLQEKHGAAKLARMWFEDCTHIKLLIGRAINATHQNPDFPKELSIKLRVLEELAAILIELGKVVEINFY